MIFKSHKLKKKKNDRNKKRHIIDLNRKNNNNELVINKKYWTNVGISEGCPMIPTLLKKDLINNKIKRYGNKYFENQLDRITTENKRSGLYSQILDFSKHIKVSTKNKEYYKPLTEVNEWKVENFKYEKKKDKYSFYNSRNYHNINNNMMGKYIRSQKKRKIINSLKNSYKSSSRKELIDNLMHDKDPIILPFDKAIKARGYNRLMNLNVICNVSTET